MQHIRHNVAFKNTIAHTKAFLYSLQVKHVRQKPILLVWIIFRVLASQGNQIEYAYSLVHLENEIAKCYKFGKLSFLSSVAGHDWLQIVPYLWIGFFSQKWLAVATAFLLCIYISYRYISQKLHDAKTKNTFPLIETVASVSIPLFSRWYKAYQKFLCF